MNASHRKMPQKILMQRSPLAKIRGDWRSLAVNFLSNCHSGQVLLDWHNQILSPKSLK